MPYLKTIIECNSCGYDYGRKYNDGHMPEITIENYIDYFDECHDPTCGLETCNNCGNYCSNCHESICDDHLNHENGLCKRCENEDSE